MEWISVEERLPKKGGAVLVVTDSGWVCSLQYSAKHKLFNVLDFMEKAKAEENAINCTHWMPLPEPPQEAEQ